MKERVYRFGPQRSLVGIYTEPSPEEMIPDAPLAVILNAGIVHHIGPFRLHVDLARRLAESGFRTLRLDLSGLRVLRHALSGTILREELFNTRALSSQNN